MKTLKELYLFGKAELKDKEEGEALILTEAFLGADRRKIALYGDAVPDAESTKKYLTAIERRKNGQPLQYITGYEYFGDMKLEVGEGVLIPREDTLPLAEEASEYINSSTLEFIKGADLCSGSGAIALYIASSTKKATEIYAVELYEGALKYLRKNTAAYGNDKVKIIEGDVLKEPPKELTALDFIVSNPPYILTEELETLQSEVKKEPVTALDGGKDGLIFYRHIIKSYRERLKKGGFMGFEADPSEMQAIKSLMEEAGFTSIEIIKDLGGLDRIIHGIKK